MISFANNNYCEFCFEKITGPTGICPKCGSVYDPSMYPGTLPIGSVLNGRFYVGKVLGKGGFGVTYLCLDMKNCTRVALKEYFPEDYAHRNSGDKTVYPKQDSKIFQKGSKGFYNEAKILSRFKDNNRIVKVEKLFVENNTAYFVMEYLVGKDLRKYINSIPKVSENLVIYIGCEILKGLGVIHSRNILHRDIAPDNIYMCDDGEIKLIDFGASRLTVGTVSNSLELILKPGFAPFEQYQTKGNQGPWTDIYALGATLYYLLKNTVPPDAVSRLNNSYIDMSGISPKLQRIISKMMAVNINDRYKNVNEVLYELTVAQGAISAQPHHAPAPPMSVNRQQAFEKPAFPAVPTSPAKPAAHSMPGPNANQNIANNSPKHPVPEQQIQPPQVQKFDSAPPPSQNSGQGLDTIYIILISLLGGLSIALILIIISWLSS